MDEVKEVDPQQPGGGGRTDRGRVPGHHRSQQPPRQQVDERDADGAGDRRGHAPAERLVAEERDARADEPLPEGRVRPAREVADPADLLAADDVPARVTGVEDLVEDQLDRPSQADQPQRRGRQRDEDDERGVEARPAPDRGGVGGGDGCRPSLQIGSVS